MPSHMRDDSAPTPRPEPSQPLEPRDPQPDLPDDLQPDEPVLDQPDGLSTEEPEPSLPDDRRVDDLRSSSRSMDPDEDRETAEAFGEMPDPASSVPERETLEPADEAPEAEPEDEMPEESGAPEPPEPFEPEETQQAPQAAEQRAEQPLPIDAEERREEAERLAEEIREEEEEEPERSGNTLWWAALIVAAIVIVGVLFIWLFLIPRMNGGYTDVQGIEEQPAQEEVIEGEAPAEGEETGEGEATEEGAETVNEGQVIGSTGPTSIVNPNGTAWNATVVDMLTPIELHGVSDRGVTIAFMPDTSMPLVNVRITSLQVGDQFYPVGTPDSPVHYQITAGPEGERDITADPTFTVGVDAAGAAYGQRVLVSVDGLTEDGYNGMIMSVDETPEGGETQSGTILLSSVSPS